MSEPQKSQSGLPAQIRLSLGTAIILGLTKGKLDAKPTTAYLMTYRKGKCSANCAFCPQALSSKSSSELLSRVTWPTYQTSKALIALTDAYKLGKVRRICIQALNYPDVFLHLEALVKEIKRISEIPISVSCQPLKKENLQLLKDTGVERVGIALDAATEAIFNKVKGSGRGRLYSWENQFRLFHEALKIFGKSKVSTHLIVGLGETEKQIVLVIQQCFEIGVLPALFAFTPICGTALGNQPQPSIAAYRRIQLARYLIVQGQARFGDFIFDNAGEIVGFGIERQLLEPIISSGKPFQTSGCPDCNRPFYNEKPSGPLYNYPENVSSEYLEEIKRQLLF